MKILIGMIVLLIVFFIIAKIQKKKREEQSSSPVSTMKQQTPTAPTNPYVNQPQRVGGNASSKPSSPSSARRNAKLDDEIFTSPMDFNNPTNPLYDDAPSRQSSFSSTPKPSKSYTVDDTPSRSYDHDSDRSYSGGGYSGGYSGGSDSGSSSSSDSGGGGWD